MSKAVAAGREERIVLLRRADLENTAAGELGGGQDGPMHPSPLSPLFDQSAKGEKSTEYSNPAALAHVIVLSSLCRFSGNLHFGRFSFCKSVIFDVSRRENHE